MPSGLFGPSVSMAAAVLPPSSVGRGLKRSATASAQLNSADTNPLPPPLKRLQFDPSMTLEHAAFAAPLRRGSQQEEARSMGGEGCSEGVDAGVPNDAEAAAAAACLMGMQRRMVKVKRSAGSKGAGDHAA